MSKAHSQKQEWFKFLKYSSIVVFSLIGSALNAQPSSAAHPVKTDGISIFGERKYPYGFKHFDYVNPNAPKGGRLTLSTTGTFNSLNPFIIRGDAPAAIGLTLASLLDDAKDRAGESYAFVAESIEVSPDHTYIIFNINPKAQFDDGVKITADTIIWSFNVLREKGSPLFRTYYKNVIRVEKTGSHQVKFYLDGAPNKELPQILGQIYALPQHFYEKVDFATTSLQIPPSSGPYRIKSIEPGRSITYERVKNWWGTTVPSQVGANNFDEIHYEFFLDSTSQFEAFKSGRIDIRGEASMKNWQTAYDFPAIKNGLVILEKIPHGNTESTYGFFFNIRHVQFQDVRIREALTIIFDFGWMNKHLFYKAYNRNLSYFPNSCFAVRNLPSPEEFEVLRTLKDHIPERIFTQKFDLPSNDSPQELRASMTRAIQLFEEAGWYIKNGRMVNKKTNTPFTFEILIDDQSKEKLCLNYIDTLERIGVYAKVRSIDKASYTQRVENKNFDMILDSLLQSKSLGNEQRDMFGSAQADAPGSRNFAGIKDPGIDNLIKNLIESDSYHQLCHRSRALDRLLLWGFYMIPAWHTGAIYVAYWDKFDHPKVISKFNPLNIQAWWYDTGKAKALAQKTNSSTGGNFFNRIWHWIKGSLP